MKKIPRAPRQRKGESWQTFCFRWELWYEQYGKHLSYGQACGAEAWEESRQRIWEAADWQAERFRKQNEAQGLHMPFPDNPHIACNQAGLDYIAGIKSQEEVRMCPWLDRRCRFPERKDKMMKVGTVHCRVYPQHYQPSLFDSEFEQPIRQTSPQLCCAEGLYQLGARRKHEGWEVEIELGTTEDAIEQYEIMFGIRPCYK